MYTPEHSQKHLFDSRKIKNRTLLVKENGEQKISKLEEVITFRITLNRLFLHL